MQVKNYCKKNQIPAQEVLELLTSQYGGTWLITSLLNPEIVASLNQVFGLNSHQLPPAKETPQLPQASDSTSNLTVPENTELANLIGDSIPALTTANIQDLHIEIQTSAIEERAEENAILDYQTYQHSYDETTRSLIVHDIYQKINAREVRRKQFEERQRILAEAQPQKESSEDAFTGLLDILKRDKYKNKFLVDKLGGL